jgi:hypothetical protein
MLRQLCHSVKVSISKLLVGVSMFPELARSIERFREEMANVDEVTHVLLKGHLLLEEAISLILDQYVFHLEHLAEARLSFHQKTLLARSLCLRKNQFGEWELLGAINALRNDLAHHLNSPNREKKLGRVKEIYFHETAGYEHIEDVKKESDAVILFHACAHCAGFLASFEGDSKAFRQMVHAMDRGMNPDLPEFEL